MLTIFTIPKAFVGHIDITQRNAIQSWLRLVPPCEVILCGDDPGVAQVASEFSIRQIPDICLNEFGTPLLNSAFERVQSIAQNRLICYVNSDIILLSNLTNAVRRIPFEKFLMIGQRWDFDLKTSINFNEVEWEETLKNQLSIHGVLHPPIGSDYFIFSRGTIGTIPPFAVGRRGWDNWMIFQTRCLGIAVIDGSKATTIIHQNHDYSHVPNCSDNSYNNSESVQNINLIGEEASQFIVHDATHLLTDEVLTDAYQKVNLEFRLKRQPVLCTKAHILTRAKWRVLQWIVVKGYDYLPRQFFQYLARRVLR